MRFIFTDGMGVTHFDAYFNYLSSVKDIFPRPLYEFVGDKTRYSLSDPKTMHDSWIEKLIIKESATEDEPNRRVVSIEAHFLGPYHDRIFNFLYQQVVAYTVSYPEKLSAVPKNGHGDVLVQEFLITERDDISHEINFSTGGNLHIVCREIEITETLLK